MLKMALMPLLVLLLAFPSRVAALTLVEYGTLFPAGAELVIENYYQVTQIKNLFIDGQVIDASFHTNTTFENFFDPDGNGSLNLTPFFWNNPAGAEAAATAIANAIPYPYATDLWVIDGSYRFIDSFYIPFGFGIGSPPYLGVAMDVATDLVLEKIEVFYCDDCYIIELEDTVLMAPLVTFSASVLPDPDPGPVPEPTSLLLFAAGLAGLARFKIMRRSAQQ